MPNGPFLEACDKPPVAEVEEAVKVIPDYPTPLYAYEGIPTVGDLKVSDTLTVQLPAEVVEAPVVEPPAKKKGGRKKKGE